MKRKRKPENTVIHTDLSPNWYGTGLLIRRSVNSMRVQIPSGPLMRL